MVNYIRYKTEKNECMNCETVFASNSELLKHYSMTLHSRFVPKSGDGMWKDPNYLFPWKDDDPLLWESGEL
jgi:hypothetical protein